MDYARAIADRHDAPRAVCLFVCLFGCRKYLICVSRDSGGMLAANFALAFVATHASIGEKRGSTIGSRLWMHACRSVSRWRRSLADGQKAIAMGQRQFSGKAARESSATRLSFAACWWCIRSVACCHYMLHVVGCTVRLQVGLFVCCTLPYL